VDVKLVKNKKMVLQQLLEENHGYLMTALAEEKGISRTTLLEFVKNENLERVARGIYISDDVWPDELYILQAKSEKIIFCGETALYLHGLIDREYSNICISVPRGFNVSHIKCNNLLVKYPSKQIYSLGISEIPSISGNLVRVYDKERCICDLIKDRKNTDIQNFQTTIKEYVRSKDKNLTKLIQYAQTLKIYDEVMKYIEVLL
jgi:predicted transcriptional regulator of viral defense system